MTYSVYILECADKSYYIVSMSDIAKRLEKHNAGKGADWNAGDILSGNCFYRIIAGERIEIRKMTLLK